MTPVLHIDFETHSELGLKVVGLDNYARHPSTDAGERNSQAKLTRKQVDYIRRTKGKVSRHHVAAVCGVSSKHVDRIRAGLRW